MTSVDIAAARLLNQRLAGPQLKSPEAVVAWFGAVQSQDYAAAKWGVGLRTAGATDASVEQAFNEGKILRTHMMRPTWHFVTPDDIRWVLALTSAHVLRASARMYRTLQLDEEAFRQCHVVLERALS